MQPTALCTKLCDKAASASSRQYDTKLLLSTFKEHSYNHTKIFSNVYLCDEIGEKKPNTKRCFAGFTCIWPIQEWKYDASIIAVGFSPSSLSSAGNLLSKLI